MTEQRNAESEREDMSGTTNPGRRSRAISYESESTEQTLPAMSYRNRNFADSYQSSLAQSSTRTDSQEIMLKINVPPPRKVCDRVLGRKCPPPVIPEPKEEEQVTRALDDITTQSVNLLAQPVLWMTNDEPVEAYAAHKAPVTEAVPSEIFEIQGE